MEQQKHICVADGSAFRNGNILEISTLNLPDLYSFARLRRIQQGAIEFSKSVLQIAQLAGLHNTLSPDARIAIQGGIVCAVAGCIGITAEIPSQNQSETVIPEQAARASQIKQT